ncbi:hypothetical protein S101395_02706 [Bacillus sonorensis]|uniref:LPXTG cell wall anchor domain-containing protein n=1 Tax=Bacillus sonorensis TaxID=119858 RepID=A0ABM6LJ76_9BACI|nr:hypothetical protein S101395_02706 [Bacillus sonorensis]
MLSSIGIPGSIITILGLIGLIFLFRKIFFKRNSQKN